MTVKTFITDTLDFNDLEKYPITALEAELKHEDYLLRGDRDELERIVAKGHSGGKLTQLVNDRRRRITLLKSTIAKKTQS